MSGAMCAGGSAMGLAPGAGARLCRGAAAARSGGSSAAVRRVVTRAVADDALQGYKATTCLFFPGQGAQSIGMARDVCAELPAAKRLFEEASETLGYDLLDRCVQGPAEVLNSTAVSQPAIFVSSMAAVEKFRATDEGAAALASATVAAGLSLGEYTALCYAGAFSFADGVKLVKARGEAMQAASDKTSSGMAAIIGLDAEATDALCAKARADTGKEVRIANYLCNGNYAVSGDMEAVEHVMKIAKPEFKARMAVKLAVAGAFHTDFMAPAVPFLKTALDSVDIQSPKLAVVSNVDVTSHADPAVIKDILQRQVTSPVQWESTIKELIGRGFGKGYELGPGAVISGIVKRIDKTVTVENISVDAPKEAKK